MNVTEGVNGAGDFDSDGIELGGISTIDSGLSDFDHPGTNFRSLSGLDIQVGIWIFWRHESRRVRNRPTLSVGQAYWGSIFILNHSNSVSSFRLLSSL